MKKILFLLMIVIVANRSFAQINSWNHTLFTTKDGLSSNVIRNVTQDSNGFIWIATESGLCRYDGDEFIKIVHDAKDSCSLPSDYSTFVTTTPEGKVLISTLKGLFVMNPKTLKGYSIHYSDRKGWESLDDKFANIYINYPIRKIVILGATAMHYYEFDMKPFLVIKYPFKHAAVNSLIDITYHPPIFLPNGDVIFWDNLTNSFWLVNYSRRKMEALKEVTNNPYYPLSQIRKIEAFQSDSIGNIWFTKETHDSLFCFFPNRNAFNSYPLEGDAKNVSWITRISFPSKNKMLWGFNVKASSQLFELDYDSLLNQNHKSIRIKNSSGFSAPIYTPFKDKDDNLWIASMAGLYMLKRNFRDFEIIELPVPYHGESDWQYVTDIKPIDTNQILITTKAEHCFLYNTTTNKIKSYLDTVPIKHAWNYWMDGIIRLPHKRWLIRGARDLIFENQKLGLGLKPKTEFEQLILEKASYGYFEDMHKNIWMSFEDKGLAKYDPYTATFQIFPPDVNFTSDHFNAIDEDKAGNIYFANARKNGIWKYDKTTNKFSDITNSKGNEYKFSWITSIAAGDNHKLYFSNHQGVAIFDLLNNTVKEIGMKEGLPSNIVLGLFYYQGNLFVSTKNGIAIMNTDNYFVQILNHKDGILEDITSKAFYLDKGINTLYTGGKGVVYKINVAAILNSQHKANVLIHNTYVNDKSVDFTNKTLNLKHNENNISFTVSSFDFNSGANKNYYYRLIRNGDTSNWRNNNKNKQFSFLNLSSGTYQIQIQSTNAHNIESLNIESIRFVIQNPWYKKWWFFTLIILVLGSSLYSIYLNKIMQIRRVEAIRTKLGRDLHDDIGSTLSSINILSRTAQRNAKSSSDEKAKASLEKINERSQRLLTNMSDIIWNINPANDSVEEMLSRMREYATTLLEAKNISYTFNFPTEKTDKLRMEIKSNLYLIFKEAVNNLAKYSGATKAIFSLTFNEKNIHLCIEDNGQGFDINEIKHRGGLTNMQHRAEEMKGKLIINSIIGEGTKINLTI